MLFDDNKPDFPKQDQPLAERSRPRQWDELIGQNDIWGLNAPLRRLAEEDKLTGIILWGPPGTGKTSLARLIGKNSLRNIIELSAVHAGVKEIRAEITNSESDIARGLKAKIVFMDEVHRLSKNQQDVLLPSIESGVIKFIGATTENPSFEVNSAIISRCLVFKLNPLSIDALTEIFKNALLKENLKIEMSEEVFHALASSAGGDARKGLNLLDAIVHSIPKDSTSVTVEDLEKFKHSLPIRYDKKGDSHYDLASAMIKSIRASHPDAAVYYMARMIEGGEDEKFIARRLVIAASEDIGNANPTALLVATNGMQAAMMVGMPEARIILSQVVTYLAASPKSNRAYIAINQALEDVKNYGPLEIPLHLRNAPTKLMKEMGYGQGYQYAHDEPEKARQLPYLPKEIKGRKYYIPSSIGVEKQLQLNLEKLRPFID